MDRATNQSAVDLIERLGGFAAVAKELGVSRQAVFKWQIHGVPPARVEALKGAFPTVPWRKYRLAVGRGRSGL